MMNLTKLFAMQKELDEYIARLHPPEPGERRIYSKVLALLVEIGELANETRCFKFWSNKGPSSRETILEEAADVLHFLLSIGNDIGANEDDIIIIPTKAILLHRQFMMLYEYARLAHVKTMWKASLDVFAGLIEMLGFTQHELEAAYMRKHAENYARQERGY
ncbi:dUTP diphosphatase [Geobacillus stearothermophilus]|nr:dUTP diphosphatase [Geobacillus stearothermophilus]